MWERHVRETKSENEREKKTTHTRSDKRQTESMGSRIRTSSSNNSDSGVSVGEIKTGNLLIFASERRLARLLRKAPEQIMTTLAEKIHQVLVPSLGEGEDLLSSGNREDRVEGMLDYIYSNGVNQFVGRVSDKLLSQLLGDLVTAWQRPTGNNGDAKNDTNKRVYRPETIDTVTNLVQSSGHGNVDAKRNALLDVIEDAGLDILRDISIETLKACVKLLQFDTDAELLDEFATDVADEILLIGAREMMHQLTLDQLKEYCRVCNYKVSGAKADLMDRLLDGVFPGILDENEKEEVRAQSTPTKRAQKESKKATSATSSTKSSKKAAPPKQRMLTREEAENIRPPIAIGITKFDLEQFYWQDEILAFCRENGINTSGNKRDQIQRILRYLENPEDKGYKKGRRGRGRRLSGAAAAKTAKKTKTEEHQPAAD